MNRVTPPKTPNLRQTSQTSQPKALKPLISLIALENLQRQAEQDRTKVASFKAALAEAKNILRNDCQAIAASLGPELKKLTRLLAKLN